MIRTVLIKLGANYVAEVERDDAKPADGPRLTFYKLEVTEDMSPEKAEALAVALSPLGAELPTS